MEVAGLVGLLDWWRTASREGGATRALSALYVQLARTSQLETARSLAEQALDMNPGAHDALELLEGLTPARERFTLRPRYVAFLERAPFHRSSPRVRETLIDLYVDAGQYDAALPHVRALTRLTVPSVPREDIVRACSVPPPSHEPFDSAGAFAFESELEIDIEIDLDDDYADASPAMLAAAE